MSPKSDFIISFLNVKSDYIDEYNIKCIDDVCYVDIKLKRRSVLAKYVEVNLLVMVFLIKPSTTNMIVYSYSLKNNMLD